MVKFPVVLLLAVGVSLPVLAAGPKLLVPAPKIETPAPVKVSPALLEFIGTWQMSDGEYVDPMMFASINFVQLQALPMQLREISRPPAGASTGPAPQRSSASEAGHHP